MVPEKARDPLVGQIVGGRYRVLRVIGEGGMGVVYEAEQPSPRRRVALKVVRGGQFVTELSVRMFQREAETLGRLKHPGIGAIYESGRTEDGQHFFAMELVRGENLDAHVRARGAPPDRDAIRYRLGLFRRICEAVNYAHQRGVVHRDLKPSNIVIGEDGAPKILDFGLARLTDADTDAVTVTGEVGAIRGTLPYMSPEQTRGNPDEMDLRTDVYALGVILYELLTDRLPYDTRKTGLVEAIRVIGEEAPAPFRTVPKARRLAGGELETIVRKALEKDPDRRYPSAAALADDVERTLTDQPILARPPSTMYQLRKLVKRNKVPFALSAGFLVLVIGAGVWALVERGRAETAARRAVRETETLAEVNRFLNQDLLGMVRPAEMGRDVALRDVVDAAAKRIEGRFADAPAVEAGVRRTLGETYAALGELDEADRHYRRAVELLAAEGTANDPEGIALRTAWGGLQTERSRYEDAEEILRAAERDAAAHHPGNLGLSGRIHGKLGMLAMRLVHMEEAEARLREAVDDLAEAFGPESNEVRPALNDLAIVLSRTDRHDEAIAVYERGLAVDRKVYGEEHPYTIQTELNHIQAIRRGGDVERARTLQVEVLAKARRVFGDEHATTLTALNNLAFLESTLGKPEEAEALYREVIETTARTHGEDHALTATAVNNLGQHYRRAGRTEEALQQFRRVLKIKRAVYGEDNREAMFARAYVGDVLNELGRHAEAEPLLAELVASGVRGLPEGHWYIGDFRMRHGIALREMGRYDEAERELRAGYDVMAASSETKGSREKECARELAELYRRRGEAGEAEVWRGRAE